MRKVEFRRLQNHVRDLRKGLRERQVRVEMPLGPSKAVDPMMQKVSYQVVSYYGGAGRGEKVGENMRK